MNHDESRIGDTQAIDPKHHPFLARIDPQNWVVWEWKALISWNPEKVSQMCYCPKHRVCVKLRSQWCGSRMFKIQSNWNSKNPKIRLPNSNLAGQRRKCRTCSDLEQLLHCGVLCVLVLFWGDDPQTTAILRRCKNLFAFRIFYMISIAGHLLIQNQSKSNPQKSETAMN